MSNKKRHAFQLYHPGVIFLYIVAALVFSMLTYQPVYLFLTIVVGSTYSLYLNGTKRLLKTLRLGLVLFAIMALINPLFNPGGTSIIFYFLQNPVTWEAVAFGAAVGSMLLAVLIWFSCYAALIDNEKFLYLFGRLLPTLALMLSMISRLIPVTKYKAACINNAQKAMGFAPAGKWERLRQGVRTTSILMSWSMEDSIETSDSMRARGYGRSRRTSYSLFRWHWQDSVTGAMLLLTIAANLVLLLGNSFQYFPVFTGKLFSPINAAGYILHSLFLLYPLLLEFKEKLQWKFSM